VVESSNKAATAIGCAPGVARTAQGPLIRKAPDHTVLQGQAHVFRPDAWRQTDGLPVAACISPAAVRWSGRGHWGVEAGQQLRCPSSSRSRRDRGSCLSRKPESIKQALAAADIAIR